MKILLLMVIIGLSGCGVFKQAGVADYEMEPIIVDGVAYCCKVSVYNTKDIGMVNVEFKKNDEDITVSLTELEVDSTDPSMVQAETTSKLVDQLISIVPKQ